jgi:signal transduction histidine kinase
MFEETESNSKHNHEKLGLGLLISKRICENLGGWIKVKSEVGFGSKFKFAIKLNDIRDKCKEERYSFPEEQISEHLN